MFARGIRHFGPDLLILTDLKFVTLLRHDRICYPNCHVNHVWPLCVSSSKILRLILSRRLLFSSSLSVRGRFRHRQAKQRKRGFRWRFSFFVCLNGAPAVGYAAFCRLCLLAASLVVQLFSHSGTVGYCVGLQKYTIVQFRASSSHVCDRVGIACGRKPGQHLLRFRSGSRFEEK